jgi:pimeloyl-ACP methyl ester carboxylesterase
MPGSAPPEPDVYVDVGAGRRVAVDDRGDSAGRPVLFVHGTPDSRLARHPDDGIAAELGIRLLAVDRPGIGHSDPEPSATPRSVADDHVAVLDRLGIERAGVLAWSSGAVPGLALAGGHPDRIDRLLLVAPLVPADAYGDPGVLEGAGDQRRLFAELLRTEAPDEIGRELAMWLVPPELDDATARSMLADSLAALESVPGAGDALVDALRATVAQGLVGLEREIAAQATLLGALLDGVRAPTAVHVGDEDVVTPPPMARWLADRLGADLHVHAGAGHTLAITAWGRLLAELVPS